METGESPRYSAFWPVAIVLAAFAVSFLVHIIGISGQRSEIDRQYKQIAPNIPKAQQAQDRLLALLDDLAKTGEKDPKDPNALQVVRLALQNGFIRQGQPQATDTNAAPANP
jgi:hypothetical protein